MTVGDRLLASNLGGGVRHMTVGDKLLASSMGVGIRHMTSGEKVLGISREGGEEKMQKVMDYELVVGDREEKK